MSRLYERMRVPCTHMVRRSVADGEGGWTETWATGRAFSASIVRDRQVKSATKECGFFSGSSCTIGTK